MGNRSRVPPAQAPEHPSRPSRRGDVNCTVLALLSPSVVSDLGRSQSQAVDEKQCSSVQLQREELWKQATKRSTSPSPPCLGLSHLMLIFAFPGMPRPKEPDSVGGRLQCEEPSGSLAERDLMADGFLHLILGGHLHGSGGPVFPPHPGAGASGSLCRLGRSPWRGGGEAMLPARSSHPAGSMRGAWKEQPRGLWGSHG